MTRKGDERVERLDKMVATYADLPRSEAVRNIRTGHVRVDGVLCRDPSAKFAPETCALTLGDRVIDCRPHRYVMLNKPQGILCVSRDPRAETVVDLLPSDLRRKGMFPAGRLDKDTVGLVLLTDDGDWAHRVLSPKKAVFKQYCAVVEGVMPPEAVAAFAAGLVLEDETVCLPAELTILSPEAFFSSKNANFTIKGDVTEIAHNFSAKYHIPPTETVSFLKIAIQEGRYHQIKRMCASVGHNILWLKRISIGSLLLDETLAEGECRELSPAETAAVFG